MTVIADKGYFIKLGEEGEWENECLRDGILRFGYRETSHEDCQYGRWDAVREHWQRVRGNRRTGTNDVRQIRIFYEADENAIFITFSGGMLYWCRANPGVEVDENGIRTRSTVNGWSCTSIGGATLNTETLSGALLRVQDYRGTICSVAQLPYLLHRINDEVSEPILKADSARADYIAALQVLIGELTWQDFEILVDLVFVNSGWRRLSVLGKTQTSVDLELQLPTTNEVAFVQVKSQADVATLNGYIELFDASDKYDKMFLVWHNGVLDPPTGRKDVSLINCERLATMVLDAGLSVWLRDKVS